MRKTAELLKNNSEDHIEMLNERHCFNPNTTAGDLYTLSCTECVPLPYEGILPPNALDWYSPLHWWDFGLIIVALSVQFRLKTIDDVS